MQFLRIIKHSSTLHSLSLKWKGFWGLGFRGDGVECLPRRLSPSRVTRMIACVLLSLPPYRELSFAVGMSVHARGRSYPHEESFFKEFQALHHMDGLEVIIIGLLLMRRTKAVEESIQD